MKKKEKAQLVSITVTDANPNLRSHFPYRSDTYTLRSQQNNVPYVAQSKKKETVQKIKLQGKKQRFFFSQITIDLRSP